MFTRKHFNEVAAIVAALKVDAKFRLEMAEALAEKFAKENPRFDSIRFLLACGCGRDAANAKGV